MPKVSEAHREQPGAQILDGPRRAFAEYGYEGATVADLRRRRLSRGAIFNYFPDKRELFYALAGDDQERVGRLWLEEGFEALSGDGRGEPGLARRLPRDDEQAPHRADLHEQWSKRSPSCTSRSPSISSSAGATASTEMILGNEAVVVVD